MTPRQFFDLVEEMRTAQKEYFKTRNFRALTRSRTLEMQIDAEIARVHQVINEPTLNFDNNEVQQKTTR